MNEQDESIQEKLIERVVDLDVAKGRWIFAIVASSLLFFLVLGLFIAPVAETGTTRTDQLRVSKNTNTEPVRIETIAIPTTYFFYFEFELDPKYMDSHSSAYIYIFKGSVPDMSIDVVGGDLHTYLKGKAFRNATINSAHPLIEWDLAFRDCDTNTFHVMVYNPDDPLDPYDNDDVIINMEHSYEPLLPLIPIFFILAFIIVLPLAIIRLYVISQKKGELRVLLSLDFESLSDEDKLRLGIPITPRPEAPPDMSQYQAAPPVPQQPGQLN
jgi:hypothetical protein